MMIVRFAEAEDVPAIVAMAAEAAAETQAHRPFNGDKLAEVLKKGLAGHNPTTFVVDQGGDLIGFQVCYAQEHIAFDETYTVPHTTWVRPGKRGSRAAGLLMANFLKWSDDIGAVENVGGNSNGFQTEQTARFFERFGYKIVGYCMARRAARAS